MLTKHKIGDFIRIKHGFPFLGEHFTDEGKYIVLTPGNFFEAGGFKCTPGKEKYYDADFPEEYLCSEGDLIVAMTQQAEGLLGSTAIVPERGVFLHNQRIGLISLDEMLSEKMYIYYLFMTDSVRQQIRRTASGSKVKHTSPERIYDVIVWIPDDVKIQKAISRTLENIDCKVALNNVINAELEKTVKLLYDYWFTQFDFPDANGKPYRASGGAMKYDAQLKREIPEGWDVKTLGRVLKEIQSGKRPAGGALQSGIPSIGAENIESFGVYDFRKEKYISQDFFSNMRKGVVKSGDVLLYKDGAYSGKASMALDGFPHQNCAVNEHVFILRTNNDLPSQFFLYLFLIRPENYNKLNAIASSKAAQPGLNQDQLNSVNVPVPPRELVLLFDTTISSMMHKIASCANQSKYLTALRDFLLPLLMNGQVTIPMTDSVVEQAPVATTEQPQAMSVAAKRAAVFKRLVLSAYILDNICDEPTSGRVKFEKLLYLSEHCAQLPLNSEFQRAAAGPYDAVALYSIEGQLIRNKWFKGKKVTGGRTVYSRLAKVDGYRKYIDTNFDIVQKGVIDKLLRLLRHTDTEQCEIIATLYGAWNDFIIDGVHPSDDQIVYEVLTNWNPSKERIERNRWVAALTWMRQNDIVPVGYGVSTK